MAFGSGRVWFGHGSTQWGSVGSLDPATGTITLDVIRTIYAPLLRTSPERPGELFIGERGLSPANVQRWDISVTPAVQLARTVHGDIGSNLRDYRLAPDGATLTVGNGSPYNYPVVDAATLRRTGLVYEGTNYPLAIAYSADGRVHAGGSSATYGFDVWIHAVGEPTSVTRIELGTNLASRGLGLSPDGTVAYAVTTAWELHVLPLDMRIDSVTPSPVPLIPGASFTITGARLSTATGVTVGGLDAEVAVGPTGDELTVLLPDGLAPGDHEVVVHSRIWTASTTVTFGVWCEGRQATIVGTSAGETLLGTSGDDVIVGLGGDDVIEGLGGDDVICGDEGADQIRGGPGDDRIYGGDGDDTADGDAGGDLIVGFATFELLCTADL